MRDFNTYWVSTVARTGSMWITNVIKEIFANSNFNVLPKKSIQTNAENFEIYNSQALIDKNKLNKYVFKIHAKIEKIPPGSKVITTIRNPYDICASYHEFMKCKLVNSINSALLLIDFITHYKDNSENVCIVNYDDIETKPTSLVKELGLFCDVQISENQIKEIVNKYEKTKIQKLIEKNDIELKQIIDENQKIDEQKIVRGREGGLRYFDLNTGFQSGHISKRENGDWKKVFSEEEIHEIIERIDPIAIKLGYNSEKH